MRPQPPLPYRSVQDRLPQLSDSLFHAAFRQAVRQLFLCFRKPRCMQSLHRPFPHRMMTMYRKDQGSSRGFRKEQGRAEDRLSEYPMLKLFSGEPAPVRRIFRQCRNSSVVPHMPSPRQRQAHRIFRIRQRKTELCQDCRM